MRKSLSDILNGGNGDFNDRWNSTAAAGDSGPLPAGAHVCHVTRGELENSRSKGTPGYKIEFTVCEGPFKGRKLWHDLWLSDAALPMTKRDLGRLGITTPAQMEAPLPRGIRCNVRVTVRKGDDGIERNRVRSFDVIGIDPPEVDPFAPQAGEGEAAEPTGDSDTSFPPTAEGGTAA